MGWVRIRSWHAVKTYTRTPGGVLTLCGRSVIMRPVVDTLPAGRSCESCLRIYARKVDAA
jgi:hypothetical protein